MTTASNMLCSCGPRRLVQRQLEPTAIGPPATSVAAESACHVAASRADNSWCVRMNSRLLKTQLKRVVGLRRPTCDDAC